MPLADIHTYGFSAKCFLQRKQTKVGIELTIVASKTEKFSHCLLRLSIAVLFFVCVLTLRGAAILLIGAQDTPRSQPPLLCASAYSIFAKH